MKGRDVLKGLSENLVTAKPLPQMRTPSSVREMDRSLHRVGEEAAAAKNLREILSSGDQVVSLDPASIDAAFIRDRIQDNNDEGFAELKTSISDNGQQVPILVRPHPEQPGRYQAAYGHRRLKAAAELGLQIRSIVKHLTDDEVLLAQGQENGSRVDLSYIERAIFALQMSQRGIDKATIMASLSADRSNLATLMRVAQGIPAEIVAAIGPALKIGRDRWVALADKLADDRVRGTALNEVAQNGFSNAESSKRFERLWRAISAKAGGADSLVFRTAKGAELITFVQSKRSSKIAVASVEFSKFLASKMPDLIKEFEKG